MSTGPRTQAAFIQGNQSTIEHDASHSALFYLFQEVSKLASPIHNSFLDTNSPSTWLHDTSRQGHFIVKKEEEDAHPFQISNGSCQHSLSCMSPYNQMKKVKEECHNSKATTLVEPHRKCNSPWKVLSLINLQCERLLHQKDVEKPDSSSVLSTTKLDNSIDKSSTSATDVIDQGVGGDGLSAEYTLRPSHLISERQEVPSSVHLVEHVSGDCRKGARSFNSQSCAKDCNVGCCAQTQNAEKADTVSVFSNRQFEWNQEFRNDSFSSAEDILHVPFSVNFSSQTHVPYAYLNAQLTVNSNEGSCVVLSKPALTLDHNANFALPTEPPCDTQLPPPSSVLPTAQSVSLLLGTTETCQSLTKQGDKITVSKPQCRQTHTEEKGPSVAQQKLSTNPSSSVTSEPEPRSLLKEEIAALSTQQWRTKTPRKQPHPRRSANIQDPDFQGVTFRMDTELDANRAQCRLLITSKYSKELCKRVRKPRLRTRASQKSIKSSSSDEESKLTTNVSKSKVCASCCTRKTPMWRDAEDGTPLCNACGIRYKKYRVRCVSCWHIPRKEGNSNSSCLKCGNFVRLTSAQRKHTT